ncbi:hypothetical protein FSP39_018963 [Pinctada imbricata]|uniref:Solute carrier family 23 member 2 n=1 Tax=Pinctada imbricata TaxID=66713 RepID=A0AA88XVV0_PINIB|nr:hypothetical protein FSP39_018963 [Pinctada imbricata]
MTKSEKVHDNDLPEENCPLTEDYAVSFYGVEDVPPTQMCFLFALQQVLLSIGGSLSLPFIFSTLLCAEDQPDVRATLFCITVFMCGVATLLQTTFGIRLGIIQGGSHSFVAPVVAMMAIEKWKCPDYKSLGMSNVTVTQSNDEWKIRMRELQGNLMLASITQVVLGSAGFIGFLMRFIGPLTIVPTISLIGLSLVGVAVHFTEVHWGISILTMALVVLFSLFLGNCRVPIPMFTMYRKCHIVYYRIFLLIPVLLSVCLSWIVCHVLTITNVLPNNMTSPSYYARTDARSSVVDTMPWFYFPYPFQFGRPTFSAAGYVGMLAATLASVMESIGDYFACARISNVGTPPAHALNRGIAMEGFASIISGMVGAGHATTSYSGNIGVIGITKVASRRVFQTAGLIMLLFGVLGKFGGAMTLIPDPVVGGVLTVGLGMVTIMGFSTLTYIDMTSTRNITILAMSIYLGLMVPQWVQQHPSAINTGSQVLDQMLNVLLGTAMFVGGVLGFILDNIVPGKYYQAKLCCRRRGLADTASG